MAHSSTFTVVFALIGNIGIAIAKYVGWFFTGLGAFLAEAFHSTADVINQAFLLVGLKRADRESDELYHYGYGKANFFWSFISALGVFVFGAALSIYHGIHSFMHPDLTAHLQIQKFLLLSFIILGVNFIVDLSSLWVALKELNHSRQGISLKKYIKESTNPTTIAVFLEDIAACLGVFLAMLSIGLTIFFKSPYPDAVGSILIGLMMAGLSIFLMLKNKSLLMGKAIAPEMQTKILNALKSMESVESVNEIKSMVISAKEFKLKAHIDFKGAYFLKSIPEAEIEKYHRSIKNYEDFKKFLEMFSDLIGEKMSDEIDRIEMELQKQFPGMKNLTVEPD